MRSSKFKLLLSGVIILVLLLLSISASFGVYYKQYTTLMKMYVDQHATLTQYQKSECSNEDPNPTYSVMMRYYPSDNMRSLSNGQNTKQTKPSQQYTYHQKIYQIKTLPAKYAQTDTSSKKYTLTHHHIEKISSASVKQKDINNIILFRSDGSINILTYEEYVKEEEAIKDLSDEELGFQEFDTKDLNTNDIQRHSHLGILDDRPSLYVSESIYGHIKIGESIQGNIELSSLTGDISITNSLNGHFSSKNIVGNIKVSDNLTGDISITNSLNGHFSSKNIVGNIDISEKLEGNFSAKTITLENVADGKAAINVGDIISVNDGILVEGSIKSTNGNGINIENGGISAKQNGILITKPSDKICKTDTNKIGCENVIQGGVGTDNYAAINITGNIFSWNDAIVITGDIKSEFSNAIHVQKDIIGASSGILVNGKIQSTATSWNCSTHCNIIDITNECKNCIKTNFTEKLDASNSNYNNIFQYIPAAINVNDIVSGGMAYGIYVQNSIETTNDSIRIDNHKTTTPPINSTYGNGVVVNSTTTNTTDSTRKNAIISKQSAIHIEGDLITSDAFDTIHFNGVVQNDFIINDQKGIKCYKNSVTDEVAYRMNYPTLDKNLSAIYVKEIYTKQENKEDIKLLTNADKIIPSSDYDSNWECYQGGNQQGVHGIIVEKINTFNDSIILQHSAYSKASYGMIIDKGVDIYGDDGAIFIDKCTVLRAQDNAALTMDYVAMLNEQPIDTDYSLFMNSIYVNVNSYIKNNLAQHDFNNQCNKNI